jgi:simple sugar transport system permease protein
MATQTTPTTQEERAQEALASPLARGSESLLVILSRYREASIAVVAILIVAFFQFRNSTFLTTQELSVVLRDTGRIGFIAAAEVLLMITGEIDLSVGSTFALAPYVMGLMTTFWGVPLPISALVAALIGVVVGLANGVITVRFHVPSLITTLGTFFLLAGLAVTIANSQPIQTPVQEPFNQIFGENLFSPTDPLFSWHGLTAFTPFLWALLVVGVTTLVLTRTTFGLHTIATGSNLLGSREIGVRTDRIKIYNFMIVGGIAAASGIINAVQYGSADPIAGGPTLTLQAIAAAVIGGTSLFGGSGTTIGALIGAFVVATLNNGLVLIGAQATQSDIYLGAAIVVAMILNVRVSNLRARRRR